MQCKGIMTYFASTISHIEKDETCEFFCGGRSHFELPLVLWLGEKEGLGHLRLTAIYLQKFFLGTHR